MKYILPLIIFCFFFGSGLSDYKIKSAFAVCRSPTSVTPPGCTRCKCHRLIRRCQNGCICVSNEETGDVSDPRTTIGHVTFEFERHREWMERFFVRDPISGNPAGLIAAMKLMTMQLTTVAMQQVQIIGTFFDAKHQLETQRLFQTMVARAHKDYHPSESLCTFGSISQSLASSSENSRLTSSVLAKHSMDRQLLATETAASMGIESDQENRLVQFVKFYCNPADNAGENTLNLDLLCKKSKNVPFLYNKDINYTEAIDAPLTLDIDFSYQNPGITPDEAAIMALNSNLFAHSLFPFVSANKFINDDKTRNYEAAAKTYMDARSIMAKRSIAQNSFASIAALKSKGDPNAQPFIYAILEEMSGDKMNEDNMKAAIGETPSYYAQMEFLTKKLYQRPEFYSDLYDKPANVLRKDVAIQAATLMQKRDLYRSYLRSEMILAVMLETALIKEQEEVTNEVNQIK